MITVIPTADAIENAASVLEDAAIDLRRQAKRMREGGDITIAAEAINTLANIWNNVRLDLFVTRPLRAYRALIAE
jgi:hypothetical protein